MPAAERRRGRTARWAVVAVVVAVAAAAVLLRSAGPPDLGRPPAPSVPDRPTTAGLPWLHVDGKQLSDPSGRPVVLRGLSVIDPQAMDETRAGHRFVLDKVTDAAAGWRPQVVRVPVLPELYLADPVGYVAGHLRPVLGSCAQKRVYCIVDWHYVDDPHRRDAETRRFWSDVAPRFGDDPHVLFEVFSSDSVQEPWSAWKRVAQPWVDLIRARAPRTVLLVGGPQYANHLREAAVDPFRGTNIAYAAHLYPGSWGRGAASVTGMDAWNAELQPVLARHPLFVTEWGYEPGDAPDPALRGTRAGYGTAFTRWADANGISSTAWVADPVWYPRMFTSDWRPTDFGNFVRSWLAEAGTAAGSPRPALRIDSGAVSGRADPAGRAWAADTGYDGGEEVDRGPIRVAGTDDPALYRTERFGLRGYRLEVPDGRYRVRLHFAETYTGITAAGQRVFDVDVEGQLLPQVDVRAEAGGAGRALVRTLDVAVGDGRLDLAFTARVQTPAISGLEVLPLSWRA